VSAGPPLAVHGFLPVGGTSELVFEYVVVVLGMWVERFRRRAGLWEYVLALRFSIFVAIIGEIIWSFLGGRVPWMLALPIRVFSLDPSTMIYDAEILFMVGIGYLASRLKDASPHESRHHRGTYLDAAPARTGALRRPLDPDTLILAGVPLPPLDETKHFKLIGTTGTGKSTAIR
jgi:hypothetical protein